MERQKKATIRIFQNTIFPFYKTLFCKKKVKWSTAVEGDPKAPFSLATATRAGEGATPFPDFTPACWYSFYRPRKDGKLSELCLCRSIIICSPVSGIDPGTSRTQSEQIFCNRRIFPYFLTNLVPNLSLGILINCILIKKSV